MQTNRVVIAVPTDVEYGNVRPVLERLQIPVLVTGAGGAAGRTLADYLAERDPDTVLLVGFAGGLDPLLRRGDLVVATRLIEPDAAEGVDVQSGTLSRVAAALRSVPLPFVEGPLLTVAAPLLTVEEKRAAFARSGAAAVDVESASLAREASRAGAAVGVVRAVVDDASTTVPPYLAGLVEAPMGHRVRVLARSVLTRPRDAVAIARIARGARLAGRRLAQFLEAYVDAA
jgi:adenosylhomocysteine nucleosidase